MRCTPTIVHECFKPLVYYIMLIVNASISRPLVLSSQKDSDFECNDVFVPENEEDGYTCYPLNAENA